MAVVFHEEEEEEGRGTERRRDSNVAYDDDDVEADDDDEGMEADYDVVLKTAVSDTDLKCVITKIFEEGILLP